METERTRSGLKLVDAVVATLVIGVLIGLTLRQIPRARNQSRQLACASNERQVGLVLLGYLNTKNVFPNAGTFEDDPALHGGDPTKSNIYQSIIDPGANVALPGTWLSSWPAHVSPYIDIAGFYDAWDFRQSYLSTRVRVAGEPANSSLSTTDIGILRCPDDPTVRPNQGNLSYVVNGGFARWHAIPVGWIGGRADGGPRNGEPLRWVPEGHTWEENMAVCRKLGVMFLGTRTGDQPWDIKTSAQDISDGIATTILAGENTLAGYSKGTSYSGGMPTSWACPLPNFSMLIASDDVCKSSKSATDCLAGQLRPRSATQSGPGWRRANEVGNFKNINYGQNLTVEGSFPFANSHHGGGANFLFCDGSVRFLSETIDGTIYAKLITPAGESLPPQIRQTPLTTSEKQEIESEN